MKEIVKLALFAFLGAALLSGCGARSGEGESSSPVVQSSLHVKRVEGLDSRDDVILGMDASCVPALERSGVIYYGFDGQPRDVYRTLAECGVTHIRVRVWNHPYDADGHGYGGGNCDLENALEIGKRATANGMKLIVDFHYSDFWADPGKQMVPLAWAGMDIEEKTEAAYRYTLDCLTALRDAGADVGMVQVGNETNGALCGETTWFNIQYIMQAGARAVREVFPDALVAVHFANPEKAGSYANYAKKLDYYGVDYDVFASSYYPYWHGTLDNLASVLSEIAETYGKKVMVMETSYAYTGEDSDFFANTVSEGTTPVPGYPFTVQGQANMFRDVLDTAVNKTVGGIGAVYWEGTWIGVGGDSWEANSALWEQHGSGWASSYAAAYDPKDAGEYYGGCAVDNQAMFDASGHPLESLKVFALVRTGNETEPVPDAAEDVLVTADVSAELALPETADIILTDGSRKAFPVQWNASQEDLAAVKAAGAGKYEFTGTAGGMPVRCRLTLEYFNFLTNGGFETGDLTGWELTDLAGAEELYVEEKVSDSLSGSRHMHFWSGRPDSVEFTLEQACAGLPAGTYDLEASIMGGDGGGTEIYLYAKIDGQVAATAPMEITWYNNWDTGTIRHVELQSGQTLTVGIYVKASGAGNGAWGKIDDVSVTSSDE